MRVKHVSRYAEPRTPGKKERIKAALIAPEIEFEEDAQKRASNATWVSNCWKWMILYEPKNTRWYRYELLRRDPDGWNVVAALGTRDSAARVCQIIAASR